MDAGVNDAGAGDAACIPLTCENAGANCGPISNGCGGLILVNGVGSCGTCANGLQCGAVKPGVCGSPSLQGGAHTVADCVNGGGVQRGIGTGDAGLAESLCEFNGPTCPTGWARLQEWGSTRATTGACPSSCRSPSACTTASHAFADVKDETCTVQCYSTNSGGNCGVLNGSKSATAQRVSVGCF